MDEKTLKALATSLAMLQIQLNAALLLLQAQHPTVPVHEQFHHLVGEGVQVAGLETMQRMNASAAIADSPLRPGRRARRSVGQHTVSSMHPSLAASRACLAPPPSPSPIE